MIEPGTRLAGRYRLEDRASDTGGATLWKAIDETLARPVSVLTFAPGFDRVDEVVTAARAASRLTDSRLVQVFDAEVRGADSYVVMEWVAGQRLDELLLGGFDVERAAGIVAEAAEALTSAHAAGLAHLCLQPSSVLWTSGGSVKVSGLGIDAALVGAKSEQPALLDTHSLGKLLYAGLTGSWPGGEQTALPTAPLTDGNHVATPRQVRAGVPAQLDSVVCRTLFPGTRRGEAITTPAELADALADVPRSVPLPIPTRYDRPSSPAPTATSVRDPGPPSVVPPATRNGTPPGGGHRPRGTTMLIIGVVVALVLVAAGLITWGVRKNLHHRAEPTASPTQPAVPPSQVLSPDSASGIKTPGDDDEHSDRASYAIDDKKSTDWYTQTYASSDFGKQRTGAGLRIDMGQSVRISEVTVRLGDGSGPVELLVGDSDEPDALIDDPAAQVTDASGKTHLHPKSPVTGRYVYIWFTRLPAAGSGGFRAEIYNVRVHGTAK